MIDDRTTDIGSYVEFSIALACTRGPRPVSIPRAVLGTLRGGSTGQYVWDLPVSTLVSVKGGKGIWGMPRHQANLDFRVGEREMSRRYDLDGELCQRPLRRLGIARCPLFTATLPHTHGVLDDHFETWFLTHRGVAPEPPEGVSPEGLESVYGLPDDIGRLDPPKAHVRLDVLGAALRDVDGR